MKLFRCPQNSSITAECDDEVDLSARLAVFVLKHIKMSLSLQVVFFQTFEYPLLNVYLNVVECLMDEVCHFSEVFDDFAVEGLDKYQHVLGLFQLVRSRLQLDRQVPKGLKTHGRVELH